MWAVAFAIPSLYAVFAATVSHTTFNAWDWGGKGQWLPRFEVQGFLVKFLLVIVFPAQEFTGFWYFSVTGFVGFGRAFIAFCPPFNNFFAVVGKQFVATAVH